MSVRKAMPSMTYRYLGNGQKFWYRGEWLEKVEPYFVKKAGAPEGATLVCRTLIGIEPGTPLSLTDITPITSVTVAMFSPQVHDRGGSIKVTAPADKEWKHAIQLRLNVHDEGTEGTAWLQLDPIAAEKLIADLQDAVMNARDHNTKRIKR